MNMDPCYKPEFDSLKELLLDIAKERSLEKLMGMIVERLAERPHVVFAGIWLVESGDICPTCVMADECPNQEACLHLVAGSSFTRMTDSDSLECLQRAMRRLPLGHKSKNLLWTREPKAVMTMLQEAEWLLMETRPSSLEAFNLGLQPLIYKGKVEGILVLHSQIPIEQVMEGHVWLKMIANHTAIAIANARAFEQIEYLKEQVEQENTCLREELNKIHSFGDIVGQSPPLLEILEKIELVAPTDASVLILGESGTGKELVAKEVHRHSSRSARPLVKVNCANIPKDLYESEFFGHIKGAFTGALKDRCGKFEAADGGTLFLDEVGEIPLELQSKLLRVLQEGSYDRIGEENTRQVNVRIIAASNRDLKQAVETGEFRRDLFYRLNVFPIEVIPLRDRTEDIPLLTAHFLKIISERINRPLPLLKQNQLKALMSYHWPGNIRELQNIVERALIISRSGSLRFDLPPGASRNQSLEMLDRQQDRERKPVVFRDAEIKEMERENTITALRFSGWRIYGPGGAAELLDLKPTTLAARIRKMGIKKPDKKQDG